MKESAEYVVSCVVASYSGKMFFHVKHVDLLHQALERRACCAELERYASEHSSLAAWFRKEHSPPFWKTPPISDLLSWAFGGFVLQQRPPLLVVSRRRLVELQKVGTRLREAAINFEGNGLQSHLYRLGIPLLRSASLAETLRLRFVVLSLPPRVLTRYRL